MAENREPINQRINFETNAEQTARQVNTLNTSMTNLDASFEEVYGDLQPLSTRLGELEDRMYELALAGNQNSQEFRDLQRAAGDYRRTIIQVDAAVDATATTMSQKLGGALTGAVSGFSAVQGAMGLLGGQSQLVEEALLRVNSAMALAQGVQGLQESANSFKALYASAKTALAGIRTGIAATGIGLLVVALGTLVAYWDDIKGAVSGVSSEQKKLNAESEANLATQKEKLDAIGGQENILKQQGKSERDILQLKIKQTDEAIKAAEINIKNSIATTKAQVEAEKRNKEILAGAINFVSIPLTLLLKGVDAIGSALGKNFNLAKGFTEGVAGFVFDPKEVQKKGDASVKEQQIALNKLKNDKAGFENSVKGIDDQAFKDAQSKRKEANDKLKEQLAEEKSIREDHLKGINALELKYNEDLKTLKAKSAQEQLDLEKERALSDLAVQEQIALQAISKQRLNDEQLKVARENVARETSESLLAINTFFNKKKGDLTKSEKEKEKADAQKFFEENSEKELEYADAKTVAAVEAIRKRKEAEILAETESILEKAQAMLDAGLITEEQFLAIEVEQENKRLDNAKASADTIKAIDDKALSDKINSLEEEEKNRQKQYDNVANVLGKVQNIQEAFGKKSKALAVASIIVEQVKAVSQIVSNTAIANTKAVGASPLTGGMPWVAINTASAALSIASSIASAKKSIAALGGGGSVDGGGASAVQASTGGASAQPNVSFVTSSENQLANTINRNRGNEQPVKAYVVSGEVTTAQSLERNAVENSTL